MVICPYNTSIQWALKQAETGKLAGKNFCHSSTPQKVCAHVCFCRFEFRCIFKPVEVAQRVWLKEGDKSVLWSEAEGKLTSSDEIRQAWEQPAGRKSLALLLFWSLSKAHVGSNEDQSVNQELCVQDKWLQNKSVQVWAAQVRSCSRTLQLRTDGPHLEHWADAKITL